MDYDVRINFTENYTCWYNDLQKLLSNINWENCETGYTIYFASASQYAEYDFRIMEIDHNKKIVELIAQPE